jgi:hypothetical protein
VQGHLERVEFDKATQIAAKYGVSKEEFREFVDQEGYYPATEETIKEAIEELREDTELNDSDEPDSTNGAATEL